MQIGCHHNRRGTASNTVPIWAGGNGTTLSFSVEERFHSPSTALLGLPETNLGLEQGRRGWPVIDICSSATVGWDRICSSDAGLRTVIGDTGVDRPWHAHV